MENSDNDAIRNIFDQLRGQCIGIVDPFDLLEAPSTDDFVASDAKITSITFVATYVHSMDPHTKLVCCTMRPPLLGYLFNTAMVKK